MKGCKKAVALFMVAAMLMTCAETVNAEGRQKAAKDQTYIAHEKSRLGRVEKESGKLRGASASLKTTLYNSLRDRKDSVNVSSYKVKAETVAMYTGVLLEECPELYYVYDLGLDYYTSGKKKYVKNVKWKYTLTKSQWTSCNAKFNSAVKNALKYTNSSMSQVEKALALHEYLIMRAAYSTKSSIKYGASTAYGILVDRKGDDSGYAAAYKYLLSKAGIKSEYIYGEKSDWVWNIIQIGSNWYHVDVAADDPTSANFDDFDYYENWKGRAYHTNFLISDTLMAKEGDEWYSDHMAADEKYDNYYWQEIEGRMNYNDTYWYFINEDSGISSCKIDGSDLKEVLELYTEDGAAYRTLAQSGNLLYYNTYSEVFSWDPKTNRKTQILTMPADGDTLEGIEIDNGQLSYYDDYSSKEYAFNIGTGPVKISSISVLGYNKLRINYVPLVNSLVSGYKVYRSTGGAYKEIGTIRSAFSRSYTDSLASTGTKYYYKLKPYKASGGKVTYLKESASVSALTTPKATKITYAAATAYNRGTIKWQKAEGASGYTVYRGLSAKGSYKAIANTTSTAYTNKSLKCGTSYYYKIRPYKLVGKTKYYGAYSGYKGIKPKLGSSSKFTAKKLSKNRAKLSWSKVTGSSGYVIYRSTKKNSGYKKVATIKKGSISSYIDKKPAKKRTNYYKIRAYRKQSGKNTYGAYKTLKIKM